MYDVQLMQWGFPLTLGHHYRLSFDVKADAERDFGVFIGQNGPPWTNLNLTYVRHATSDWRTMTIEFDAWAVFTLHKLSFEIGIQKINMYFANISLIDLGPIPVNKVAIVGTFQSELGCSYDWSFACDNTALTYNSSTGLWSGTFNIPAGCYEYQASIDGSNYNSFGENGDANSAWLYVPVQTMITFTYNPTTRITETSPIPSGFSTSCLPRVVIAASFQNALGCGWDWDANCSNTALTYNPATGLFENDFIIPWGNWQYRVILNGDWYGNNFGVGGKPLGNDYSISINSFCPTTIHFAYDPLTHVVTATSLNVSPNTVVIAGSFQSEVGCSGDWQPDCDKTRLHSDPLYGGWVSDTLSIPSGHWEYKVTINNSWNENYGLYGQRNGPNIPLELCSPAKVVFHYSECYHDVYPEIHVEQPQTVVIPGSFQNEVGCAGDWQPNCDNTRMHYDAVSGKWVDTLFLPAGHWEYKFAVNGSWDENYGLGGARNGENIQLDLCYPAKVVFDFYYSNCYGYGGAQVITNGICLNKFYDANVNRSRDYGEEPMSGVQFTLTGNGITQTQTTGSDGKAVFTNLPDGLYVITENVPAGYYTTAWSNAQSIYLSNFNLILDVGNVCLGAGGAKGIGYWTSKNGEAALKNSGKLDYILSTLRYYYSLRNADGSDFDPNTYDELKRWMQGANAKNMTYMLSAQLAAMFLNTELGLVDSYNSYIYTPGCSWWGNFMGINNLMWYTNYYLWFSTTVDGKNPQRDYLECLKNAFDNANNNLTFVQPHPCTESTTSIEKSHSEEMNEVATQVEAKVWPNPSNKYFTLRPANAIGETVHLKVYNVNGQEIYKATGAGNKDFRFGESFKAGIYFAEVIQGNNKTSFKLVKQ